LKLLYKTKIGFQALEDIKQFQKKLMELEDLKYQNPLTFVKTDSVIRLKISVRRERIRELAKLGLTQKEIASDRRISVGERQVRRDIKAIREDLDLL
jgi:hypothetical protein